MMLDETAATAVNQLRRLDEELETILTSFDTSYAWNYGNLKEGLRDLYEKAKRDQWNGTTQLSRGTRTSTPSAASSPTSSTRSPAFRRTSASPPRRRTGSGPGRWRASS